MIREKFGIDIDSGGKEFSATIAGMTALIIYLNILEGLGNAANDPTLGFFQKLLMSIGCEYDYTTALLISPLLIAYWSAAKFGIEDMIMLFKNFLSRRDGEHKGLAGTHFASSLAIALSTVSYPYMIAGINNILKKPPSILALSNGAFSNFSGAAGILSNLYQMKYARIWCLKDRKDEPFKKELTDLHTKFEISMKQLIEKASRFGFDPNKNEKDAIDFLSSYSESTEYKGFLEAFSALNETMAKKSRRATLTVIAPPLINDDASEGDESNSFVFNSQRSVSSSDSRVTFKLTNKS